MRGTSDKDTFYANKDGNATVAGKGTNQQYLRIGATNNNGEPQKTDVAMVVAGSAEIRGGTFIRKVDNADSNA